MQQQQTYTTVDRHGYSLRFSPFDPNHLLLASSQLYGLAGGGTLFLLEQSPDSGKGLSEVCRLEWSDGLFDVAWCPYADNIAATASGDGSLQIWGGLDASVATPEPDTTTPQKTSKMATTTTTTMTTTTTTMPTKPLVCLQEHKNEVYSVEWGEQWNGHQLLSASWDGTIKLWDCNRQNSVCTYVGHTDLIYCARFSPLIANLFASVGTDGYLNLWNSLDLSGKPLMSIEAAHASEVLCCDWSQFDRNVLLTGGSDGMVRAWDLRNMRHHIFELFSGEFAVRRLACSPTAASVVASANYDFTTRIWDFGQTLDALEVNQHHTEFVCGLDWNMNRPHQLADCGWDAVVNVFTPRCLKDFLD